MTKSGLIGYFGYGSLVNTNTLRTSYVDHLPAKLHGWCRSWCVESPGADGFRSLSIYEDPSFVLDGAIVIDRSENLAAVDERETGYDRITLSPDRFECEALPENLDGLYIYRVKQDLFGEKNPSYRIRRSYLDAVAQGYLRLFGEDGLRRFFQSTRAWDMPLEDDRANPAYPRAVELSAEDHDTITGVGRSVGISL